MKTLIFGILCFSIVGEMAMAQTKQIRQKAVSKPRTAVAKKPVAARRTQVLKPQGTPMPRVVATPVSTPAPTPIAVQPKQQQSANVETKTRRRFFPLIKAEYAFFRLDTEDSGGAKGVFVSKLDASPFVSLGFSLSEKFRVEAFGRVRFVQIEAPVGYGSDQDTAVTLPAYGVGTRYFIDEERTLNLHVSQDKELYIRGLSTNRYEIDSTNVIKAKAGIEFFLGKVSSGPLSLRIEGQYFLPGTLNGYKSKAGMGFVPTLYFRPLLVGGHEAEISLGYSNMTKDTEIYKMSEQSLILGAGVVW